MVLWIGQGIAFLVMLVLLDLIEAFSPFQLMVLTLNLGVLRGLNISVKYYVSVHPRGLLKE